MKILDNIAKLYFPSRKLEEANENSQTGRCFNYNHPDIIDIICIIDIEEHVERCRTQQQFKPTFRTS